MSEDTWKWWNVRISFTWMHGAECCAGEFKQHLPAYSRDQATARAVERVRRVVSGLADIDEVQTDEDAPALPALDAATPKPSDAIAATRRLRMRVDQRTLSETLMADIRAVLDALDAKGAE